MENGIVECVPSFGMLDAEFVANLFGQQVPIHTSVYHFFPINMEIAAARNAAVKVAMEKDCEYLFFRDYDTMAPVNALSILIARQLDVVGGLYYSKTRPPYPLMFVDGRPQLHHTDGALVKVEALGMGCTLIKTDVLRKLGPPWFKTGNKSEQFSDMGVSNVAHTEDTYFCKRIREELGIFPYVDTGIRCTHKDIKTGVRYIYDPEIGGPAWIEPNGEKKAILPADHPKARIIPIQPGLMRRS